MFLTVSQAAKQLGVSSRTVRRACERIGIARHGRNYMISLADLERLRSEVRTGPGNPGYSDPEYQRAMARKRGRKQL